MLGPMAHLLILWGQPHAPIWSSRLATKLLVGSIWLGLSNSINVLSNQYLWAVACGALLGLDGYHGLIQIGH